MKTFLPEEDANSIAEGIKRGVSVTVDTSRMKDILLYCLDARPLRWHVDSESGEFLAKDYNDLITYVVYQNTDKYNWSARMRLGEVEFEVEPGVQFDTVVFAQRACENFRKQFILSQIIFNG